MDSRGAMGAVVTAAPAAASTITGEPEVDADAVAAAAARRAKSDMFILNAVLKNSIEQTYRKVISSTGDARKMRSVRPFYLVHFPKGVDLIVFIHNRHYWACAMVMPFEKNVYDALTLAWRSAWRLGGDKVQHLDDVGEFHIQKRCDPSPCHVMYFALHTDHMYTRMFGANEYGIDYVASAARFYYGKLHKIVRRFEHKKFV